MKNKKLNLAQIEVKSFVTKLVNETKQMVNGGDGASSPTGCPLVCNDVPFTAANC